MVALRLDVFVADGLGLQEAMERAVLLDQEVLGAARDPKEAEVLVDGLGCIEAGRDGCLLGRRGAEGPDPMEAIVVVERDGEGMVAAHGKPGEGARLGLAGDAVVGFDEGNDVLDQLVAEGLGVLGRVFLEPDGARRDGVRVGHDDDHGLGAAGCDERVEDPVSLAVDGPRALVVAVAMREVEHGQPGALGVGRRGVNDEPPPGAEGLGVVVVQMDGAMGDVLEIPGRGRLRGHVQDAGVRPSLGLHPWVLWINRREAIHDEPVLVDPCRDVGDRRRPQARILRCLVPRQRRVLPELPRHLDLRRLGRTEPERDGAVGVELG